MLIRLRNAKLDSRRSAVLGGVSFAFLIALMLAWLSMSTRTAVLNKEIDTFDARRLELEDKINLRWRLLGDLSNPVAMAERAERLGFKPVKAEYLVIGTTAVGASTTLTVTTK